MPRGTRVINYLFKLKLVLAMVRNEFPRFVREKLRHCLKKCLGVKIEHGCQIVFICYEVNYVEDLDFVLLRIKLASWELLTL